MAFVIGGNYYYISDDDYQLLAELEVDLSDFFDGGDGNWYIAELDFDDEVAILEANDIVPEFYTYITSTQQGGGSNQNG